MSTTDANAHAHDTAHHDHSPFLAHHWDTPQQQFEAGKLGMWLFLATEVLLFGGLFCGYAVWRSNHPELFRFGSQYLDTTLGAINTAVLILSSLTMAWGVTAAQRNQQRVLRVMLCLTLAGAAGFLVIKYFEYTHKFNEGIFPGMSYYDLPADLQKSHSWDPERQIVLPVNPREQANPEERLPDPAQMQWPEDREMPAATTAPPADAPRGINESFLDEGAPAEVEHADDAHADDEHAEPHGPPQHLQDETRPANAHMFFNIYFMMTGLHGIHVVVGGIVIIWLLVRSLRGDFSAEYFTPVDLGGLYWHVVDLIWIFLFPLFYLI